MASRTRYSKGHKIHYRLYFPDGTSRVGYVFHSHARDAIPLVSRPRNWALSS
jgi:hypothetical protein